MLKPRLKKPVVGQAEIVIRTTPDALFDFIGVGFFSNYPRWSPEVVELEQLSDGEIGVGTLARQVRIDQRHRLESKFQVTTFAPDERLVFEGVPDPFRCTFDIRAVDPGNRTGAAYGLTGVPETFIVDRKGILREKFIGPRQWNAPEAKQMLMKYLVQ